MIFSRLYFIILQRQVTMAVPGDYVGSLISWDFLSSFVRHEDQYASKAADTRNKEQKYGQTTMKIVNNKNIKWREKRDLSIGNNSINNNNSNNKNMQQVRKISIGKILLEESEWFGPLRLEKEIIRDLILDIKMNFDKNMKNIYNKWKTALKKGVAFIFLRQKSIAQKTRVMKFDKKQIDCILDQLKATKSDLGTNKKLRRRLYSFLLIAAKTTMRDEAEKSIDQEKRFRAEKRFQKHNNSNNNNNNNKINTNNKTNKCDRNEKRGKNVFYGNISEIEDLVNMDMNEMEWQQIQEQKRHYQIQLEQYHAYQHQQQPQLQPQHLMQQQQYQMLQQYQMMNQQNRIWNPSDYIILFIILIQIQCIDIRKLIKNGLI